MSGRSRNPNIRSPGSSGALSHQEIEEMRQSVPTWCNVDDHHLERGYSFPDFETALLFTNCVGQVAEEQGHHPEIRSGWGRVLVQTWTHSVNGITEADFLLAAGIDRIRSPG